MRQQLPQPESVPAQRGFAIVVVLAALLVLTVVFAVASKRSIAHLQVSSAETTLSSDQSLNASILAVLAASSWTSANSLAMDLTIAEQEVITIQMQDVGGLIDLNTASPQLLSYLFSQPGFPNDAHERFNAWRLENVRINAVRDLIRIVGADPSVEDYLDRVTTIYSGRRGISAEAAPDEVLALFGGIDGEVPSEVVSASSAVNFAAYLVSDRTSSLRYVGTFNTTAKVVLSVR